MWKSTRFQRQALANKMKAATRIIEPILQKIKLRDYTTVHLEIFNCPTKPCKSEVLICNAKGNSIMNIVCVLLGNSVLVMYILILMSEVISKHTKVL
jgi:ABC-type microcin C transport system permease subunit YejE